MSVFLSGWSRWHKKSSLCCHLPQTTYELDHKLNSTMTTNIIKMQCHKFRRALIFLHASPLKPKPGQMWCSPNSLYDKSFHIIFRTSRCGPNSRQNVNDNNISWKRRPFVPTEGCYTLLRKARFLRFAEFTNSCLQPLFVSYILLIGRYHAAS